MRDGMLSEATVTYNVDLDVFVVREKLGIAPVMIVARDEAITGKMPNMVIGPGVKKWMCTVLAQADRGELKTILVCPLPMPIKVFGATEEHLRRRPFAESNEQQARTFSGTSQAAHGKMYRSCEAAMKGRKMTMKLVDDIVDNPPNDPPAKRDWLLRVPLITLQVGFRLLLVYLIAAWVSEFITDLGEVPLTRWYVCKHLLVAPCIIWCGWYYFVCPARSWWRARRIARALTPMENK